MFDKVGDGDRVGSTSPGFAFGSIGVVSELAIMDASRLYALD